MNQSEIRKQSSKEDKMLITIQMEAQQNRKAMEQRRQDPKYQIDEAKQNQQRGKTMTRQDHSDKELIKKQMVHKR